MSPKLMSCLRFFLFFGAMSSRMVLFFMPSVTVESGRYLASPIVDLLRSKFLGLILISNALPSSL